MITSCKLKMPDSKVIVKQLYDKKTAVLKKQHQDKCKKEALEKAEAIVDSLVHDMLQLGLADTLGFPSRPIRPEAPEHIIGTVKKFEVDK